MSFTPIVVQGSYQDPDGSSSRGTVSFALNGTMTDAVDSTIVSPEVITATLDTTGHFSQSLYANDDSTTLPTKLCYLVTEQFSPSFTRNSYYISVPHTAPGGVLDLSSVVHVTSGIADSFGTGSPNADAPTGSAGTSLFVNHYDHVHPFSGAIGASVHLAGALTWNTSTQTLVKFDTVDFDTNNGYNASTGLYTVPANGIYVVTVQMVASNPADTDFYFCYIYKNEVSVAVGGGNTGSASGGQVVATTKSIQCVSGDTLAGYNFGQSAANFGTGAMNTFMSIAIGGR